MKDAQKPAQLLSDDPDQIAIAKYLQITLLMEIVTMAVGSNYLLISDLKHGTIYFCTPHRPDP